MRTRRDLNSFFQRWPKWALVLASVLSLPVFLVCGAVVGVTEYYQYWVFEVSEMLTLQQDDQQ